MLGDFVNRSLVMVLGYAYPAFECYKTVEKNKVEIEQLRFWCQYWIIIAAMTVLERFGDIFVSWLPMYGEMKLAFIIYLWSSKTKGTGYIYETFLRPYIAMYETDIDRNLFELRERALDYAIFYWQYCLTHGQSTFYRILQYIAAQSLSSKQKATQKGNPQSPKGPSQKSSSQRRPSVNLMVSQLSETELVQEDLLSESVTQKVETKVELDQAQSPSETAPESDIAGSIRAARIRLRRSQPPSPPPPP